MALTIRNSHPVRHNAAFGWACRQYLDQQKRLTSSPGYSRLRGPDRRRRAFTTSIRSPASHRVLVVGGGPAGCTTAYFLAKAGLDVTVIERSVRSPYGQGLDITNQAVEVVKRMGLLDTIKANMTGETGFALLDDTGRRIGSLLGTNAAQYESVENDELPSFTNEIEIMRGTLNEILADAAKQEGVKFRYGCTITNLRQYIDCVSATLSDNKQAEDYMAIIGADGVGSLVAKLVFPEGMLKNSLDPTNTFAAYFSMDLDKVDQMSYSRLQHGGGGRAIWVRPIDRQGTRASGYFITTTPTSTELEKLSASLTSGTQQQEKMAQLYADMGGIKDVVVQGMRKSDDWHFTRLVQVKLPTWHIGRCALVGDAAYCPTPLTGQGTSMALMGAYILAGELAANPTNPGAAFAEYKRKFDPYVKEEGMIPLGGRAPNIFVPQSRLAVWALRQLYSGFSNGYGKGLFKFLNSGKKDEDKFRLPMYKFKA
ncbi:hypothetical protein LTR85_003747 [Meristemomyces frigidus]|nr:hypothetical protein LTR85_003747 [Meristemomyces frigidus]